MDAAHFTTTPPLPFATPSPGLSTESFAEVDVEYEDENEDDEENEDEEDADLRGFAPGIIFDELATLVICLPGLAAFRGVPPTGLAALLVAALFCSSSEVLFRGGRPGRRRGVSHTSIRKTGLA